MSRRKAFETSLTSANSSRPSQPSTKKDTQRPAAPSSITAPEPATSSGNQPAQPESRAEKAKEVATAPSPAEVAEVDDSQQCFICAEPITFWSVGVCGHRTCHVCAIRLRVFYKKKECTFCKTPTPSLLFSRSPATPFPAEHHVLPPAPPNVIAAAQANADKLPKGKRWDEGLILPGTLELSRFDFADEKLGVAFEDEAMMEETLLLLRFNCPYPDCAHMATDWASLEKHTLATHGLVLCTLCRKQLSRFAHEQILYPPHLLPLHDPSRVARGQRPPRPRGEKEIELVKSWEAPHPMCEFCHEAFFGPDELFAHMRSKHEECFVCKQLGEKDVYFANYTKLEQHFNSDHYPCLQPSCLEKKFVVFPTEMDLRAHVISEHGGDMSARDRAQARQLPVEFSQPPSERRGNRQAQAHSGRGFTLSNSSIPNGAAGVQRMREVPPHQQQISQPPPMSDAQAAQHRRQTQTDRQEESSRRRRAFETGLTGGARELEEEPVGSGFSTPREDVDEAVAARHAALLSRVDMLTGSAPNKMTSFRSAVRQFRNAESGPKDLIDTVFNVLDRDADATTGVVREVASLFDNDGEREKQQALLAAVNSFRIEQREQFPSLSGAPTGFGSHYAGITSGAILNAKRSTQTHRGGGAQIVWDRVEAAAASHPVNRPSGLNTGGRYVPGSGAAMASSSSFPSLGSGSGGSRGSGGTHSTPWSTGGAGSSSKSPSALTGPIVRSVNPPTKPSSSSRVGSQKAPSINKAAFPSLPTSSSGPTRTTAEERRQLLNKPSAREESLQRLRGSPAPPPAVNGWGTTNANASGNGIGNGNGNGVGGLAEGVQGLAMEAASGANGGGEATGGGGKKKNKGKQLLFSVSARPS